MIGGHGECWLSILGVAAAAIGSAGLLAGGCAYAARWPTSQIFGHTLIAGREQPGSSLRTVALTYDDGPSERYTGALLELLARHDVRATFFLIGNHVRRYPELARSVADAGHLIGNHTVMHPDLARKDLARIRNELMECQNILADVTGVVPKYFRPPYGSRRPAVLRMAREFGLTPVLWNVAAQDWNPIGVDAMLRRVDRGIERNARSGRQTNLLLHDASHLDGHAPQDRADTLRLTERLLRRDDLRFVTVDAFDTTMRA